MELGVDVDYAIFCICYDFNKYHADLIIHTMRLTILIISILISSL